MTAKVEGPSRAELATLLRQIASLPTKSVGALAKQYEQLAGEPTRSRNKQYLVKRVAFLLQEQAHGGLSKAAEVKISELGDAVPAEWRARIKQTPQPEPGDTRLPPVGSTLTRTYKRIEHAVKVLAGSFEYQGRKYKTLTDVTRAITGKHRGGFEFFGLGK